MSLLPALVSIGHLIAFSFMPESPRFLAAAKNVDAAKTVLMKFRVIDRDVESELMDWAAADHRKGFKSAVKDKFRCRDAVPLFGVAALEQMIGAVAILFYFNKILALTGKRLG